MTCYFHHMSHIFARAGIVVTKDNKKNIDQMIHELVGVNYKDCPAAWKAIKLRLAENESEFIAVLEEAASCLL